MKIYTIENDACHTAEIRKSRFMGYTFRCSGVSDIETRLKELKREHSDATHCCWGYVYGLTGEHSRYNDDGEPHGTAGPPILDVIKKKELTMLLTAVIRYYGGIKLGAGGLIRAYGGTASKVISLSGIKVLELTRTVSCALPYPLLAPFERLTHEMALKEIRRDFTDKVTLVIRVPVEIYPEFLKKYTDLTSGGSQPEIIKESYT